MTATMLAQLDERLCSGWWCELHGKDEDGDYVVHFLRIVPTQFKKKTYGRKVRVIGQARELAAAIEDGLRRATSQQGYIDMMKARTVK